MTPATLDLHGTLWRDGCRAAGTAGLFETVAVFGFPAAFAAGFDRRGG